MRCAMNLGDEYQNFLIFPITFISGDKNGRWSLSSLWESSLRKKRKKQTKKQKKNEPVVIKMLKNGGNLLPWPEFE